MLYRAAMDPRLTASLTIFAILAILAISAPALAVRPFVTDDARVADQGQLELEIIPDLVFPRGERALFEQSLIASFGVLPFLELGAGGAIGTNHGDGVSIANPELRAKLLFLRADPRGIPGAALVFAAGLPYGRGVLYSPGAAFSLIAPLTSHLFGGKLLIHLNVGLIIGAKSDDLARVIHPYAGLGVDASLGIEGLRFVGEIYTGEPLAPRASRVATQLGGRYEFSERFNLDLVFGASPAEAGSRFRSGSDLWVQLGARVLFDAFRKTPGDPEGGAGLFKAKRAPRDPERAPEP